MRTFGDLYFNSEDKHWYINNAEPHVCIKLKAIFTKIARHARQPFKFNNLPETCHELTWFTDRYPLKINDDDRKKLLSAKKKHLKNINDLEAILLPTYIPRPIQLKNGKKGRQYQFQSVDLLMKVKRLLNGDDIGTGKSVTAILGMLHPETLPCLVVVQTHMPKQWKEMIEEFSDLKVHLVKGTKPYDLPQADIYITKYSCLLGWVNVFEKKIFKSCIFDEVQELRHSGTGKYNAAVTLSQNVEYVLGLSASPMYNYAIEIYNILNVIKPDCLGDIYDFMNEWLESYHSKRCKDPDALGAYLRENYLLIRRSRKDVGRELPPINKIIHTVPYDTAEVEKAEDIAKKLAIKVAHGSFMESGQAARELDIYLRHSTGVAKAKGVAEYVKILLENNTPIILAGWHRDVYDIWLEELKEYNPVMYTGTENPNQKEKAKQAFINGETNLFIISLRSGIGLDGLQAVCNTVVIGELDFSPKVHDQLIGRADREDKEQQMQGILTNTAKEGTTAIFLITDAGSDPAIVELLGLKASQTNAIMNPFETDIAEQYSDESRMKQFAKLYLEKINTKKEVE